jgi:membrane associated rhomboid family serine protease
MGIESRGYYRDSFEYQRPWSGGSGRTMVVTLIIINVAIFALDIFTPRVAPDGSLIPGAASENSGHWLSHFLSLKSEIFQRPWQFFNLLTYGFAHSPLDGPGGPMHLVFNMLSLYFLGFAVESLYGRKEFLRIYLTAVVVSGLAFLLSALVLGSNRSCVGASGAVTTVVALFILNFPRQKLALFGVLEIPAWVLGVILIVTDLLRALNPSSRIAVETHLMGAAFAAAYFYGKWNFGNLIARSTGRRPRLEVHDPDVEDAAVDTKWERLQAEGDRLLDKIKRDGQDSLTWSERRTLKKYSHELRQHRK